MTQVAALALRDQHNEEKWAYYNCKNVEKALKRHIQDTIEENYLESLIDKDTQIILEDIPTVLEYIFDTYGKVPLEEVKGKEAGIRTITYHPADPMIILDNPIENLKKDAEAAGIPYTTDQLLNIGINVIQNTRDFERTLGDWELLGTVDKTWEWFKEHFYDVQQQLCVEGPPCNRLGATM